MGSLKNPTFRGGGSQKTNIEGGLPKKGGLGQFANLRVGLAKKRDGVLVGLIPQCALWVIPKSFDSCLDLT